MSEQNYNQILREIGEIKESLRDLEVAVGNIEVEIKNEMQLKHQEIDYRLTDHDKFRSFTEKGLFTATGAILLAVLYAILRTVGL